MGADDPQPFATSFPTHPNGTVGQVDVAIVKAIEFTDPHPRRIHQFENGTITDAPNSIAARGVEEPQNLLMGEE